MGHSHGTIWSEQKIIDKINEVKDILMVDRMPSRKEIEQIMKNASLTCKISKTGGFKHWAARLGLDFKDSETRTGMEFEDYAIEFLVDKGYTVNKMSTKHPYDLLINDRYNEFYSKVV